MPGKREGIALLAALVLGALLRIVLPWPAVVTEHGILPPGGADEFYHLRRIEYSVENFPSVLAHDAYVNAPDGGEIVWPPLWDLGIAAVALPLGAGGDRDRLEAVTAAIPPLVGLATIWLVFVVARRQFGARAAATSALMLAFLPAHYLSSRLGKSDHHVGAVLATAWLLFVGMRWLDRPQKAARTRTAVELGLAMAVVLLIWTGALLHVGLTLAVATIAVLGSADRETAVQRGHELALACATAALAIAPFSLGVEWLEYGGFSPLVLSSFQPVLFAAGALVLSLSAELWKRTGLGETVVSRVGLALGLGVLGLGGIALAAPELGEALLVGAGWFQEAEDFQSHVLELRSMWMAAGSFSSAVPQLLFTRAIALVVPVAVWLGWRAMRGGEAPGVWLLVVWGLAFFAAASSQIRFSNELAVPVALLAGAFVGRAAEPRMAAAAGAFVVASASLLVYSEPAGDLVRASRGEAPRKLGIDERIATLVPFARWLGTNSKPTSGWMNPGERPGYAVLTPWGHGHLVRYYARRAMVQDNFGVYGGRANYDAAEDYYAETDEARAIALLGKLDVRYVLAAPEGSGHGRAYEPLTMARRMALHRGFHARDVGSSGQPVEVPALSKHRLIHEAAWKLGIDEVHLDPLTLRAAAYRWFQIVEGARIEGQANPGSTVTARITLTPEGGPSKRYEVRTRANSKGRYRVIVPYPTGDDSTAVASGDHYRVIGSSGSGDVVVSEDAVQSGETIEGPDLVASDALAPTR
jgi:dolichyl-diphosphooligosaccharide--protein glycosyltransferase